MKHKSRKQQAIRCLILLCLTAWAVASCDLAGGVVPTDGGGMSKNLQITVDPSVTRSAISIQDQEIGSMDIVITYTSTSEEIARFTWNAGQGPATYSVAISRTGTYTVELIYYDTLGVVIDGAGESADFIVQLLHVTRITIRPGAVIVVDIDDSGVSALEGEWIGYSDDIGGIFRYVFQGSNYEIYMGRDLWIGGTFTTSSGTYDEIDLLIQEYNSDNPEEDPGVYINQTVLGIFEITGDHLVLKAGGPHITVRPADLVPDPDDRDYAVFSLDKITAPLPVTELTGRWIGYSQNTYGNIITMEFLGNYVDLRSQDDSGWFFDSEERYTGTFTLNTAAVPPEIDFHILVSSEFGTHGTADGLTSLAIYQVTGDELMLVGNTPGDPARPVSFTPAPGDSERLFVCTREQALPLTEMEGYWTGYKTTLGGDEYNWSLLVRGNYGTTRLDADGDGSTYGSSDEWWTGVLTVNEVPVPKEYDSLTVAHQIPGSSDNYIGMTSLGIYSLSGTQLTMAGGIPGSGVRPTDFTPAADKGVYSFSK